MKAQWFDHLLAHFQNNCDDNKSSCLFLFSLLLLLFHLDKIGVELSQIITNHQRNLLSSFGPPSSPPVNTIFFCCCQPLPPVSTRLNKLLLLFFPLLYFVPVFFLCSGMASFRLCGRHWPQWWKRDVIPFGSLTPSSLLQLPITGFDAVTWPKALGDLDDHLLQDYLFSTCLPDNVFFPPPFYPWFSFGLFLIELLFCFLLTFIHPADCNRIWRRLCDVEEDRNGKRRKTIKKRNYSPLVPYK